jgi:chemotaxis protein CheC
MQLDALRELANIGSGTAATALSSMLGRSIDVSVPVAQALPLSEAVESAGAPDSSVTAVVLPIFGDIDALVLLLIPPDDAHTLCSLLGVDADTDVGLSALGEIGNILGSAYVGALGMMTGLDLEPRPPQTLTDLLGAIVATALATGAQNSDIALMLDSDLIVEGETCTLAFMLVPSPGGVGELLTRLGLGG